jgi:hypothetical protein
MSASHIVPPLAASAVAWGGTGVSVILTWLGFPSWGEFSGFCASILTILLVIGWVWDRFWPKKPTRKPRVH